MIQRLISLRISPCLFTLLALMFAGNSYAGDMLSPKRLVAKSDAIALVRIDLKTNKIKAQEWIQLSDEINTRAAHNKTLEASQSTLSSLYVPQRKQLKLWSKRYPRRKQKMIL